MKLSFLRCILLEQSEESPVAFVHARLGGVPYAAQEKSAHPCTTREAFAQLGAGRRVASRSRNELHA
eukprot:2749997-Pleurochrysis_carterae.AAC.1